MHKKKIPRQTHTLQPEMLTTLSTHHYSFQVGLLFVFPFLIILVIFLLDGLMESFSGRLQQ